MSFTEARERRRDISDRCLAFLSPSFRGLSSRDEEESMPLSSKRYWLKKSQSKRLQIYWGETCSGESLRAKKLSARLWKSIWRSVKRRRFGGDLVGGGTIWGGVHRLLRRSRTITNIQKSNHWIVVIRTGPNYREPRFRPRKSLQSETSGCPPQRYLRDLKHVALKDLGADDNGAWQISCPKQRFQIFREDGHIKSIRRTKDYGEGIITLRRQYAHHKATKKERNVIFTRIISSAFDEKGLAFRFAVVQVCFHIHIFCDCEAVYFFRARTQKCAKCAHKYSERISHALVRRFHWLQGHAKR